MEAFLTGRRHVFLGEAGCGKSEIAVNLALRLAAGGERVRFFDLDMTKPLFRSRELAEPLTRRGVEVCFAEQFMDAPTAVGGPARSLREDVVTILDVGGGEAGAAAVGQYAGLLRQVGAAVDYVINPFRPWSGTTERIDAVLSAVLDAAHWTLPELRLIGNPNLGPGTTPAEFLEGYRMLRQTVAPYKALDGFCAERAVADAVAGQIPEPVSPLDLWFQYPWREPPIPDKGEGTWQE